MPIKTNGLTLKSFYSDAQVWLDQEGKPLYWIDDIILIVDGLEIVEDSFIKMLHDGDDVQILTGVIYSYKDLGEISTLVDYFKLWQHKCQPAQPAPHHTGRQSDLEDQASCPIIIGSSVS